MDSHLIYSASDAIRNKITWVRVTPDTEWIYFGSDGDIDKQLVINTIYGHFRGNIVYIAFNRKESLQLLKQNIEKEISRLLGLENFLIWDDDFKKVIEFNRIGTMRCGEFST